MKTLSEGNAGITQIFNNPEFGKVRIILLYDF